MTDEPESVSGDVTTCAGCGARIPHTDYPTHAYLSASPACWLRFNDVLSLHYSNALHWPAHQRLTDAYTLQHSDGDDRRARRSAVVHLVALAYQVESDVADSDVVAVRRGVAKTATLPILKPPRMYSSTIVDVSPTEVPGAHYASVENFAGAVWEDWKEHHAIALAILAQCRPV